MSEHATAAPSVLTAEEGIPATIPGEPLKGRHILIIVENLPLPFDRRVWQEARTLKAAGADVSIICPTGKGYEARREVIEGITIHRHPLPLEAKGALGFLIEYGAALFWETVLAWRIFFGKRFHVIQGCNPPDLIFLVALPFKLLGVRYIFDHHDINPELYEAKFNKRGFFWQLMVLFEKLTFKAADVSIATNHSYRKIAIERGGMPPERVYVVRSGPDLSKLKRVNPAPHWKNGRAHLVGYVGVMGEQEGIDLLIEAAGFIVRVMRREDIQFVLVGGGPALASLKDLTQARGLADYITFTGRAPDQELFEVLSTMDLGVNPDRVNAMNDKSTMNKVMEYMSSVDNRLPVAEPDHADGGCGIAAFARAHYCRPAAGARAMIGRTIWVFSCVVLAFITIQLQFDRQAAREPVYTGLVLDPFRANAQFNLTAVALYRQETATALAEARKLVMRRPVPAEHLTLLAGAFYQGDELEPATLAVQFAAQRGWRDPIAQEARLRLALEAGDEAEAARRFVALMLNPDVANAMLNEVGPEVFARAGGEAEGVLVELAGGTDRWHSLLLRRGADVIPPQAFASVIASSIAGGAQFECGALNGAVAIVARKDAVTAEPLRKTVEGRCSAA